MTAAPLATLYHEWLRRVRAEVEACGCRDPEAAARLAPACLGRAEVAAWALDGHASLATGGQDEEETDPHVPVGPMRPPAAAGR